jgi:hypothetical protein
VIGRTEKRDAIQCEATEERLKDFLDDVVMQVEMKTISASACEGKQMPIALQ